jgi:hypothetical protein
MGELMRPRFGQPCFVCGATVPTQRIAFLRSEAALERRRFLKSDIVCFPCDRLRDRDGATVEPRGR